MSLEKQRAYRKLTGNRITKKYEKTINGFLMRTYRNMKSRVTGVLKLKAHLYKGLEILPKEQFYEWAKNDKDFNEIYTFWKEIGYDKLSSPSIDRIDPKLGYTLNNMRWVTQYENSAYGLVTRYKKC